MEKGQTPSAGSEPEVIEVTGQERGEQEVVGQLTNRGVGETNSVVEEKIGTEVPLI